MFPSVTLYRFYCNRVSCGTWSSWIWIVLTSMLALGILQSSGDYREGAMTSLMGFCMGARFLISGPQACMASILSIL